MNDFLIIHSLANREELKKTYWHGPDKEEYSPEIVE